MIGLPSARRSEGSDLVLRPASRSANFAFVATGADKGEHSRPETAIALSVKPPFNVGGQGQPQAVAPGPTGKRSSLKPFEIKRD